MVWPEKESEKGQSEQRKVPGIVQKSDTEINKHEFKNNHRAKNIPYVDE